MPISNGFEAWFRQAASHSPYAYQYELAEADSPPSVLAVPTGCGKTQAVIGAWMYQRHRGRAPRRLVYALPMRTLVEQTRDVAIEMRASSGMAPEELPIHVLMGGEEPPEEDWRLRPDGAQILIGTIDMLLSRALNRGYGESRFDWPVSFGLLNSDCRWAFDEVQLMGPARATSAQLDGLRAALGTALPCESMWVSATVDPEALQTIDRPAAGLTMTLPKADREGPLKARLTATKTLERADLGGTDAKAQPAAIAALAAERHRPGTLTLVVLNRVEAAQETFSVLKEQLGGEGPKAVLLHSRFRPDDRAAHMAAVLAPPDARGTIAVSTQVVEAGVDLSARTLLTETAPFSSIVQRLGRCNRAGGSESVGQAVWLDSGPVGDDAAGLKAAAPYLPEDLAAAREQLLELVGESLSPQRLEGIEVSESPDDSAMLRRRDLIDLFDTSPDLSGTDIDIAPFIREDDQRTAIVCFREIGKDNRPAPAYLPDRVEVVQVPLGDLKKRRCWKLDHVTGAWELRSGERVPPGATVVLDAADGGYTGGLGWKPGYKLPAETIAEVATRKDPEGTGGDETGGARQELPAHLEEVASVAAEMAKELGLDRWAEAVIAAAALHDVGKAHPAFQQTLREAMAGAETEAGPGDDEILWAKSGTRGGAHRSRPFLRHELASALALRALDGAIELPERNLTIYLVAAHHGRVRLSIRPAPGEAQEDASGDKRFALGIVDGDRLPAVTTRRYAIPETTLDLGCMALGAEDSWTRSATALRDSPELGPFRLAFLEAVVRLADWRVSASA